MKTAFNCNDFEVIDLFCGGGGVTTGIESIDGCKVTIAINHNREAILTHKANHKNIIHLREDVRVVNAKKLPNCNAIWASAECIHFSGAAGGRSRNADSRSLPFEICRYGKYTNAGYVFVENVREFLTWGPLIEKIDENGDVVYKVVKGIKTDQPVLIPDPKRKGETYKKWVKAMEKIGYINYEYRILNSADYGANTSRERYIGIFSKAGYPIAWPEKTHDKHGKNGLPKWLPCKEKINLLNEGNSIFGRKKPLSENTLKRIAYGVEKYALNEEEKHFIMKYYGNGNNVTSIDDPLHTITTKDRHVLVKVKSQFIIDATYGIVNKVFSTDEPLNTLTTQQRHQLITVEKNQFISRYFNSNGNPGLNNKSIDDPLGSITTEPKDSLITVEKRKFIESISNSLNGIEIVDIKMRFLDPQELKEISGFPADYKLPGTKKDQIKAIGNAVPPPLAKAVVESNKEAYYNYLSNYKVSA